MSEISNQIIEELLEDKLNKHRVWVWYDPREKYRGIVDDVEEALESQGINLARYDGSYLELKANLWKQDPDIDQQWVFYIPRSQSDAEWFKDIHTLGRMYRPTVDVSDDPAASYLVERTERIPQEFSEWGTDPEQLEKAFFTVLFSQNHYSPRAFLLKFFEQPGYYLDLIKRYEQEGTWRTILDDEYGIEDGMDPMEIAKAILFADVEAGSPTERYSEIAADETTRAADFCEYWQRNGTKTYLEYATDIESDHDLRKAVVESNSLDWRSDAFLGIEEGLLQLCLERFKEVPQLDFPNEVGALREVVQRRMECFWYEDGRANYWTVLDHGLRVVEMADAATSTVEGKSHDTDELTESYTNGWWEIDAAYRNYVQSSNSLVLAIDGLDEAKEVITGFYTRFLRTLNRKLATGLESNLSLGGPQTGFWDEYVEPNDETAIIICDGLRYELACELVNKLDELDAELSLNGLSAALPSVTEVGMAAHLPGDLGLQIDDDGLVVTVGGERMDIKSDRDAVLESEGFEVENFADTSSTPVHELQSSDLPPRVVYSGVIDKLGESLDSDEQALGKATDHIQDVERIVRKLKSAGYSRFVITADHGFLYTERLPDDLKIRLSDDVDVLKRRFAATRGIPPEDPSLITLVPDDLRDLGIDSDGISLSFPRSVACFTAPGGNMRYFHGGISMQELIVPCVTIEVERDDTPESQFDVDVSFPTAVTNNIVTVEIEPEGQMSIASERTIILRATVDDREVCDPKEVSIQHGGTTERLRLKTGELEDESSVLFEALDGETREVIETQRSKLDIVIRDDGFDI